MEPYPIDIDPAQVVRWVMAEQRASPSTFRILARRATEFRDIPLQTEPGLGDEEREDLSEIATIATLEIAPFHASEGWRLTVTVEDEIGPRAPDDDSPVESEEEMISTRSTRNTSALAAEARMSSRRWTILRPETA